MAVFLGGCVSLEEEAQPTYVEQQIEYEDAVPVDEAYDDEPTQDYTPDLTRAYVLDPIRGERYLGAGRGWWRQLYSALEIGDVIFARYADDQLEMETLTFAPDIEMIVRSCPWFNYERMMEDFEQFGYSLTFAEFVVPDEYHRYIVAAYYDYNILFTIVPTFYRGSNRLGIKNIRTGETKPVTQAHALALTDRIVAISDTTIQVTLYDMQTGKPAEVQLDFDYGNAIRLWGDRYGYERFAYGLGFNPQTRRYYMLYTMDPISYATYYQNFQAAPVWLAIFDENGRQLDSIEIDGLAGSRTAHHFVLGAEHIVFFDDRMFFGGSEINYVQGTAEMVSGWWSQSAEYQERLRSVPNLPLTIVYTLENTFIYTGGEEQTLLQTLDGGYMLSFYTFNDDGDVVMLFYRWRRQQAGWQSVDTLAEYLEWGLERGFWELR